MRLIAATNVNLEDAVIAGRFREDLYYRLSVAVLNLPPLRLRPGDILPLARYFLASYGKRLGCPDKTFSAAAEALMLRHYWHGNIRELENAVHHAVLVAATQEVAADDFKLSTLNARLASSDNPQTNFDDLYPLFADLCKQQPEKLAQRVEQMLLQAAYDVCNHNQLAVARLLGLSRHVVRAKLIAHDIIPANRKTQTRVPTNHTPPNLNKLLLFPFKARLQDAAGLTGVETSADEMCTEVWGF